MANESNILQLAKKRFGSISEAEKKFLRAVVNGLMANYISTTEKNDDPEMAEGWGNERVVRAEVIAWLCTNRHVSTLVTHRGIAARGVRVEGRLNLHFARIMFPLCFEKCTFPEGVNLRASKLIYSF
jgi:hypothetical protein